MEEENSADKSVDKNEKKENKFKTKNIFLLVLLILILIFTINKIITIYQLKTQVIAIVRFDFIGLENMFHSDYEYYAITENNKAIKISKKDMIKINNNYKDDLSIYDIEKENTYRFSYYLEISDDKDFKYLTEEEQKEIEKNLEKICKTIENMDKREYITLYTNKNNNIVEYDSNHVSYLYRYKDGKLNKIMDCPSGTFHYIYFTK